MDWIRPLCECRLFIVDLLMKLEIATDYGSCLEHMCKKQRRKKDLAHPLFVRLMSRILVEALCFLFLDGREGKADYPFCATYVCIHFCGLVLASLDEKRVKKRREKMNCRTTASALGTHYCPPETSGNHPWR